jgi:endonuclease YncB( thermonuclease family)
VSRLGFAAVFALVALVLVQRGGGDSRAGLVERVVDGDTIVVQLRTGRAEKVRVLGIDAPEAGTCWAAQATAATRRLADGKHVTLIGDATQATRDRYGRLLAYVWLAGGRDLGFQLVAGGYAKTFVFDRPFKRLHAYAYAEGLARGKGVWRCGGAAPAHALAQSGSCHPSYKGACLDPNASDYDCAGGSGNGPEYTGPVRVVGYDQFGLDADGDGYGCEDG